MLVYVCETKGTGRILQFGCVLTSLKPLSIVLSKQKPNIRERVVNRHSISVVVRRTEVEHCVRISLLRGEAIPADCLFLIFLDTPAVNVHHAEIILAFGIACSSSFLIPIFGN